MYRIPRINDTFCDKNIANVTAGLMCPPESTSNCVAGIRTFDNF